MSLGHGSYVKIARNLHPRLLRFFAHNPPEQIVSALPQELKESFRVKKMNPFQAHKHPGTGRWHPPIYSLRRQADLVKMAEQHHIADLLPFSKKKAEVRLRKRVEEGLKVRGTGVGQKVKGHKWERSLQGRLEVRRQAMLNMPKLIEDWKRAGHGRGWKKWPSGKSQL